MNAREQILAAVRAARVAAVPRRPARAAVSPKEGRDARAWRFSEQLTAVGGRTVPWPPEVPIEALLDSLFGSVWEGVLVLPGRFAVAENGAVYVDANDTTHRADVVSCEHLVLIVSSSTIVDTMHDAMPLIPRASACGWFLSGPSKTADIEQSLVIGAQGARTLTVLLRAPSTD
ncbi:MAG: LUD domain-containing protein [Gemmatimonadaceae bacterium]|nr:LUD domain-containing protein [Gemmatimonadaceae bacterium]